MYRSNRTQTKTNKTILISFVPLLVVLACVMFSQTAVTHAQYPTDNTPVRTETRIRTETWVPISTHTMTRIPERTETHVYITRTPSNTPMRTETHVRTETWVPSTRTSTNTPERTETHVYITRTVTNTPTHVNNTPESTETRVYITRTPSNTPVRTETPESTETRVYITRTVTNTAVRTETHVRTETPERTETRAYITRTPNSTAERTETPRPTRTRTQTPVPGPTWTCGRVIWTNLTNVTVMENTIRKTGGASGSWDAGATSRQVIPFGTGFVQASVVETNTYTMFGLNQSGGTSETNIDYGLVMAGGTLVVYENGTVKGNFGPYAVGDALRIASVGGVVRYFRNDTLLYTSAVAPQYPLRMAVAINTMGGRVGNTYMCYTSSFTGAPNPDDGR